METLVDKDDSTVEEIVFFCTNCGTKLAAEPGDAGSECECPECHKPQLIPEVADVVGTPVAAVSTKPGRKKITIHGSIESPVYRTAPEVVDDSPVGRIFRFLAAVLGLAGLGGMVLAFVWVTESGKPHPSWLDLMVDVAPLLIAGFTAIIVARVAFIIGSLAVRYDR